MVFHGKGAAKMAKRATPKNGARKAEVVDGIFADLSQLSGKKFGTIYTVDSGKWVLCEVIGLNKTKLCGLAGHSVRLFLVRSRY